MLARRPACAATERLRAGIGGRIGCAPTAWNISEKSHLPNPRTPSSAPRAGSDRLTTRTAAADQRIPKAGLNIRWPFTYLSSDNRAVCPSREDVSRGSRTMWHRRIDSAPLQCPVCHGTHIRRSRRRGLLEWLASLVGRYPFRCEDCNHRFKRFRRRTP
jgi:hypothetical protein